MLYSENKREYIKLISHHKKVLINSLRICYNCYMSYNKKDWFELIVKAINNLPRGYVFPLISKAQNREISASFDIET
jgi:hypothetical protein